MNIIFTKLYYILKLIFLKKKAHMVYKRSHCSSDYYTFSRLHAQCKMRSVADYTNFVTESEKSLSTSPTYFWCYVYNLFKLFQVLSGSEHSL